MQFSSQWFYHTYNDELILDTLILGPIFLEYNSVSRIIIGNLNFGVC